MLWARDGALVVRNLRDWVCWEGRGAEAWIGGRGMGVGGM